MLDTLTKSRIDPVSWNPPEPPEMTGVLEPNTELAGLPTVVSCDGPEDVAFDDERRLYTGTEESEILRTIAPVDAETTNAELERFAQIPSRGLGLQFAGDDLLVAATRAGLLSVDPQRSVETLSNDGIGWTNDLYVHDNGTVYFTDSTLRDPPLDELFELRDTGRLLAYHPESGETTVELDGLGFANGVCPHVDGESILITETVRYQVTRYWIDGDREGESERFAENFVGHPDNIESPGDGTYLVTIPVLRSNFLDTLHGHSRIKRQFGKLPEWILDMVSGGDEGLLLHLDEDGKVFNSYHDPSGEVFGVTSATPHEGNLYVASLYGEDVVRYPYE